MLTNHLPRVTVAHLPTPLEPLPRLTAQIGGPELWVKRDDQTGLATGGNKARKLEFLVAEALQREADILITCGAQQSNHARQTAAAGARFGLDTMLVLRGEEPARMEGNLLLDHLLGAQIIWAGVDPPHEVASEIAQQLEAEGRRPYVVPYGGSNPVGASGYVAAMEELTAQCEKRGITFDHIVLASSSGGTQAGLVVAARATRFQGRVLGISIDLRVDELKAELSQLATATAAHLGLELALSPADFSVDDGYLGGGYGVVSDLERSAIETLARSEGLLLDPVYTGRAFGGLLDLLRDGGFQKHEKILFWHTGGTAALFGKPEVLPPA